MRNLKTARLRTPACVEDIDLLPRPGPRPDPRPGPGRLAGEHRDLLISGPPAPGRPTWPAHWPRPRSAGATAPSTGAPPRLLDALRLAHADGTAAALTSWSRIDLLVLDDLALVPLTTPQAADLLEVIEDRHQRRSTILTSQRRSTPGTTTPATPPWPTPSATESCTS